MLWLEITNAERKLISSTFLPLTLLTLTMSIWQAEWEIQGGIMFREGGEKDLSCLFFFGCVCGGLHPIHTTQNFIFSHSVYVFPHSRTAPSNHSKVMRYPESPGNLSWPETTNKFLSKASELCLGTRCSCINSITHGPAWEGTTCFRPWHHVCRIIWPSVM